MIIISPQFINQAGGVLQAISLKAAEVVSDLAKETTVTPPTSDQLGRLNHILLHAAPHLDEYMAVLLFRASLPPEKRNLPVEEISLTSRNNDRLAKVIWPTSVVFGIGGTHTGGAYPLLKYDEHVQAGRHRRDTSCTKLTTRMHYLK